ncbi:hypothetical protein [Acidithiobacillus ferrianus]
MAKILSEWFDIASWKKFRQSNPVGFDCRDSGGQVVWRKEAEIQFFVSH